MSTEFIENLSSPLIFSPILRGNALPRSQGSIISGTVINFDVNPVKLTEKADMFNRYYLSLGNPNPLSGIL